MLILGKQAFPVLGFFSSDFGEGVRYRGADGKNYRIGLGAGVLVCPD